MRLYTISKTARYQLYFPDEKVYYLEAIKILVSSVAKAHQQGVIINKKVQGKIWKVESENGYSAVRIEFFAEDIVKFKSIVKYLLKNQPQSLIKTLQPNGTLLFSKEVKNEPCWSGLLLKLDCFYKTEIKKVSSTDLNTSFSSYEKEKDKSNEWDKVD